MAGPIADDRVKQTSTTTGTGTLSLSATIPTGAISFVTGVGSGNTCFYCIAHQTLDEWEIGLGTVTSGSPDTLARTTVLRSTNSNAAVSFSSGTKDAFLVAPAKYGLPIYSAPTTFAISASHQTALSATAGNARGTGAVDFQLKRDNNTKIASGSYSTLSGGRNNTSSNYNSVVSGGIGNACSGISAVIGGGSGNTVGSKGATIAGGFNNTASQSYNFVGGGYGNTAGGSTYATICGGISNSTGATRAFVGGGDHNSASASYTAIAGGLRNTTSATGSAVLGGFRAVADKYCQQAHAAGFFAANGDAQRSEFVLRKSTTNGTQTELFLDGSSNRMTIANDTTWAFYILISARRTDANDESAAYEFKGCIDRNASAGTTAIVGTVTKTVLAEDTVAWDVDVNADATNGALRIQVTGEAAKTIQWVAFVLTAETTG